MLPSKDVNFVGYTYKNFEIVSDSQLPGIGKWHSIFGIVVIAWCGDNMLFNVHQLFTHYHLFESPQVNGLYHSKFSE